ncbi:MAG: ATP-binding protein, partial [Desulfobulbaceae bacterium]|nr:ATP-binding protein [Desulfobulbaceae bacterium]
MTLHITRVVNMSPAVSHSCGNFFVLHPFNWTWPKKINQLQVQNLFRLKWLEDKANVILLGGVGLGKTHLSTALAYAACLKGH